MPLIEVEDASFSYGDNEIFSNFNFQIERGQVLCLLGPNGCGKTTLMDCIMGFHDLKKGRIFLDNADIRDMDPRQIARKIAYVPQIHTEKFPYKVLDVVLMGRAAYTSVFSSPDAEDKKIAEEALAVVDMEDYKDRIYTKLSGGESQLILIARALAQKTPIIILDEPTAHLDFQHELRIMETIVDLVKNNKLTIIMATHFPNHAFYFQNNSLNTSILMMNDRGIAAYGEPYLTLSVENVKKVFNVSAQVLKYYDRREEKESNYIIPLYTIKKSNNSKECYLS